MRRWEKLTDGRERLVIDQEDGTRPMYIYGKDREEILDKAAGIIETGQQTIQRMRSTQQAATPPKNGTVPAANQPQAPRRAAPTSEELLAATADITNPAKAPQAAKTLLRAAGLDVDEIAMERTARRIAAIGQQWEKSNPDFPSDERNMRLLFDTAKAAVGFENITAQALDVAYAELQARNMLFPTEEPAAQQQTTPATPAAPADGSPQGSAARTRTATSYSRHGLRAAVPAAGQRKEYYTQAELDAMNTHTFKEKVLGVPAVLDWFNKRSAPRTAAVA